MRSLNFAILLLQLSVLPYKSIIAFVNPTAIHLTSKRDHPGFTISRSLQQRMTIDPFSFVDEQVDNIQQSFNLDNYLQNTCMQESLTTMFSQDGGHLATSQIQTIGETSLAALTLIAFIQGALIMHQYATNPAGELIAPPGLTVGVEDASNIVDDKIDVIHELYFQQGRVSPIESTMTDEDIETLVCNADDEPIVCTVKKGWYHVNQFLVFALPWLVGSLNSFAVSMRFGHLLHMAVILGLAHIYDFFRKLPIIEENFEGRQLQPPEEEALSGSHPNILVLGDSMAVGIGCVDKFDIDKNSSILQRTENLNKEEENEPGPVFPRTLARTLSRRIGKPVSWRSAGVDGGDTNDIRQHLIGIVQEEVDKGQAPDIVVVLTGSNDLKHILDIGAGDRCASVRGFRSNLMTLAQEIQAMSPKSKVVFPSLPTYRLDRNSILNVFPLTLFLDSIIGFWDAQKIEAAENCGESVLHVGLTVADVNSWYKEELSQQRAGCGKSRAADPPSLLSADGIHPNAKCYGRWAFFLGNKIADELVGVEERYNHHPAYSTV